jgi:acetolactate synthase-1/2/3 large subunit
MSSPCASFRWGSRSFEARALGPVLHESDGPILLDCKVNPEIAAPFMGEFVEFEARHQ